MVSYTKGMFVQSGRISAKYTESDMETRWGRDRIMVFNQRLNNDRARMGNCINEMASHKYTKVFKSNGNKARIDLIPSEAIFAMGTVLAVGVKKHGERDWENGYPWSYYFGALMRHMWAWWGGDKVDKETGHSHLWHALCCIAFLVTYEERSIGTDDRSEDQNNQLEMEV